MIKAKIMPLKRARLERGWNSADLARASNINKATIGRIERGSSTSPPTAKRVADALEMPVTDLFDFCSEEV